MVFLSFKREQHFFLTQKKKTNSFQFLLFIFFFLSLSSTFLLPSPSSTTSLFYFFSFHLVSLSFLTSHIFLALYSALASLSLSSVSSPLFGFLHRRFSLLLSVGCSSLRIWYSDTAIGTVADRFGCSTATARWIFSQLVYCWAFSIGNQQFVGFAVQLHNPSSIMVCRI